MRFSSQDNIVETPYQPQLNRHSLYDQRCYDPTFLLESEAATNNSCDLRQLRSYHPAYYDEGGGGTTTTSGSRIVDLIPRSQPPESDYAILTFPPPPPAIDLLNESMASTGGSGLGSTSMLNAITPGDRMAMPLPNPAMAGVMPEEERKIVNEFCHLLEKSKQLFNGLRDLPQYGHKQWQAYFGRTFDIYTKLWKFQQQHRAILDARYGLKRWQIGEIASKIGQLYYHY